MIGFAWIGELAGGQPYRSQEFPTQADAEHWLGEVYLDLVDDGVQAVTLVSGESVIYGPMSLLA